MCAWRIASRSVRQAAAWSTMVACTMVTLGTLGCPAVPASDQTPDTGQPVPGSELKVKISGPQTATTDDDIYLKALVTGATGDVTYVWSAPTNLLLSTAGPTTTLRTTSLIPGPVGDVVTVSVTVSDASGATAVAATAIIVTEDAMPNEPENDLPADI